MTQLVSFENATRPVPAVNRAEKVPEFMRLFGISLHNLALALHIRPLCLKGYLSGTIKPKTEMLVRMAAAFGVPVQELLLGPSVKTIKRGLKMRSVRAELLAAKPTTSWEQY